jgi:AcrR family transcriptional regulator
MPRKPEAKTRRTSKVRIGGRAAEVVERIVEATIEELGRVGYQAMRVEDIAARSGVNKTTIYRRWPAKAELFAMAVRELSTKHVPTVDTGTLKGDLRASLLAAFDLSPYEQGVLRMTQMERSIAEVDLFARRMRGKLHEVRVGLVQRGIERGELPKTVDIELVVELVSAPVQRALLFNESMDGATLDRMLDLVLAGAAATAPSAKPRSRRATTTRSAAQTPPSRRRKQQSPT